MAMAIVVLLWILEMARLPCELQKTGKWPGRACYVFVGSHGLLGTRERRERLLPDAEQGVAIRNRRLGSIAEPGK